MTRSPFLACLSILVLLSCEPLEIGSGPQDSQDDDDAGDDDALGDDDGGDDDTAGSDGIAWQPIQLDFVGPQAHELDSDPNPFLDFRLMVTFEGPSGQPQAVPGFFDGDGAGGSEGDAWRVRFTPDQAGQWRYTVAFEQGEGLAIADLATAGTPLEPPFGPHGEEGTLSIAGPDGGAEGTLGTGRLEAVGEHYLRLQDGQYWLRGGADSPENFLAYAGFDATTHSAYHLHDYDAHVADWQQGDPDWGGGAGKGIIGALNYLSSVQVNSLYLLLMNIGGDGQDVWPFAGAIDPAGSGANDNLHYDLSKLAQWEAVFGHAQRRGIALHLVLGEAEWNNKVELDDAELGTERKLYYREMIARFAHHNALQWNISEEYNLQFDLGPDRVKAFAQYLQDTDPYDHPITVHNSGDLWDAFESFAGFAPITLTSFQLGNQSVEGVAEGWREYSASAGHPWAISLDEFTVDTDGQTAPWDPVYVPDDYRRLKTWPIYLSGGQLEFILQGYLAVDDFRPFEQLWAETWFARRFVEENLPFWEMEPADHLLSGGATFSNGHAGGSIGGQVFARPGEVYAVYVPDSSATGYLDLTGDPGTFTLRWYNPRTGTFEGDPVSVQGGGVVGLGNPPTDVGEDWAALLEVP